MQFQIITPERVVFSEEIDQISMMTEDGEITVLPHHIPLVTNLKPGELRYKQNNEEKFVAISGGFGVVRDDGSVVVLADTAEHAADIDLARAEEARARAAKLMEESRQKDSVDFSRLAAQLEKELNRVRTAKRYRKLP